MVKISDFGTCREWNEISTKMSFAGTVAWMAPEIIRNEPCSEKVDIWYVVHIVIDSIVDEFLLMNFFRTIGLTVSCYGNF